MPKWKIRSENSVEPIHTLATNVAIEEGQLLEEVRASLTSLLQFLPAALIALKDRIRIPIFHNRDQK